MRIPILFEVEKPIKVREFASQTASNINSPS